jgi:hypothetical protein
MEPADQLPQWAKDQFQELQSRIAALEQDALRLRSENAKLTSELAAVRSAPETSRKPAAGGLVHYTLNTGRTERVPRPDPADVDRVSRLTAPGKHDLSTLGKNFKGFTLNVARTNAGYFATLISGKFTPLLAIAVASTAGDSIQVWPQMERLYESVLQKVPGGQARRPEAFPWLAVAWLSTLAAPAWAVEFERSLAWAWIEDDRSL